MPTTIDNTEELQKFLNSKVMRHAGDVLKKETVPAVMEEIKDALVETVYANPTPETLHDREGDPSTKQGGLFEAVVFHKNISKIFEGGAWMFIGMDERKLSSVENEDKLFSEHLSLPNEETDFRRPFKKGLLMGLEYGPEVWKRPSPYWNPPTGGYGYMEKAFQNMTKKKIVEQTLQSGFRKIGIDVSYK